MTRKIGIILLAVFLIAYAFLAITNLQFQFSGFLMGVLAGAAGLFLLLDR